ncbi:hypothetical protein GLOTRDRAFT_134136 [Gloeophyllum trabeum ATCC 11539]|uniref:Uncharacterized protein n=1 Tax=Gloeophyllum trabeum (strain ATCC 11539 / FP-39264 / Madison 617) TaxID=670483 RepID=S7R774_GLOTA|nr:uncharacterized protein GLOTRDRAFT_134136 [Gloeophyllum trabeum ATCC 11539]EPQ50230.1 hypothetical protein GLOTRDRAFT_134136 [Gloeophyllum trabeum ATCC 11539]
MSDFFKLARLAHSRLAYPLEVSNRGYQSDWFQKLEADEDVLKAIKKPGKPKDYYDSCLNIMRCDLWPLINSAMCHTVHTLLWPVANEVGNRDGTAATRMARLMWLHEEVFSFYFGHEAAWQLKEAVFSHAIKPLVKDATMEQFFWDSYAERPEETIEVEDSNTAIGISESASLQEQQAKALQKVFSLFKTPGLGGVPRDGGSAVYHPEMAKALIKFAKNVAPFFIKEDVFYANNKTGPPHDVSEAEVEWWLGKHGFTKLKVASKEQVEAYWKEDQEDSEDSPVVLVAPPPLPSEFKKIQKRKEAHEKVMAKLMHGPMNFVPWIKPGKQAPKASSASTTLRTSSGTSSPVSPPDPDQPGDPKEGSSEATGLQKKRKRANPPKATKTKKGKSKTAAKQQPKSAEFVEDSDSEEEQPLAKMAKGQPKSAEFVEDSDSEEEQPLAKVARIGNAQGGKAGQDGAGKVGPQDGIVPELQPQPSANPGQDTQTLDGMEITYDEQMDEEVIKELEGEVQQQAQPKPPSCQ